MKIKTPWLTVTFEIGTLGLRVGEWYGDLFLRWRSPDGLRRIGCFVNDGIFRRWSTLTLRGWQVNKVEVLDAENAARIFRRTMRPGAKLVHRRTGRVYEACSYPIPNYDNTCTIVVSHWSEVQSDEIRCEEFEFNQWHGRTGIPACDPIERSANAKA